MTKNARNNGARGSPPDLEDATVARFGLGSAPSGADDTVGEPPAPAPQFPDGREGWLDSLG